MAPDGNDPHYPKKQKSVAFCAECHEIISVCLVSIIRKIVLTVIKNVGFCDNRLSR